MKVNQASASKDCFVYEKVTREYETDEYGNIKICAKEMDLFGDFEAMHLAEFQIEHIFGGTPWYKARKNYSELTEKWIVYIDAVDYSLIKERRLQQDMYNEIYEADQILGIYFTEEEVDEAIRCFEAEGDKMCGC